MIDPSDIEIISIQNLLVEITGRGPVVIDEIHWGAYSKEWLGSGEKTVRLYLQVGITAKGDRATKEVIVVGNFGFEFIFEVENLEDWISKSEEGGIKLDAHLRTTLRMLAYSTARGMVLLQTSGTGLDGFILPVIHPNRIRELEGE